MCSVRTAKQTSIPHKLKTTKSYDIRLLSQLNQRLYLTEDCKRHTFMMVPQENGVSSHDTIGELRCTSTP